MSLCVSKCVCVSLCVGVCVSLCVCVTVCIIVFVSHTRKFTSVYILFRNVRMQDCIRVIVIVRITMYTVINYTTTISFYIYRCRNI